MKNGYQISVAPPTQMSIKIRPVIVPVVIHVEIGKGAYHRSKITFGMGPKGMTFVPIQTSAGKMIPMIHIGSINKGFHTIEPNTKGSLILKTAGIKLARPSAFSLVLLENACIITKGNVQPTPPTNKYAEKIVSAVTRLWAPIVALAVIAARKIGLVTGVNTQLEIPMEYKKQYKNIISMNPQGVSTTLANGIKIFKMML